MKLKFEVELGMSEKITYSINTRSSDETISKHDNLRIHEKIDKVMMIFRDDKQ